MENKYVVFDLDDTLYYEIDFLKSAFNEIASRFSADDPDVLYDKMLSLYYKKEDAMGFVASKYAVSKEELLEIYRNHYPSIVLRNGVFDVLNELQSRKIKMGLLSDGRSVSQRNKIKALGIEGFFDHIIISEEFGSEKPNQNNFNAFMLSDCEYFYVGDNPKKDFVSPNHIGWTTIMINDDKQKKIHLQPDNLNLEYLAQIDCSWEDFLGYVINC